MSNKGEKRGRGRPPKPVTKEMCDIAYDLASHGATQEEVAANICLEIGKKISVRTLMENEEFSRSYKKGFAKALQSLRSKQFEMAMRGSVPMLIWLGKNNLNQTDRVDQKHDVTVDDKRPVYKIDEKILDMPPAERLAMLEALEAKAEAEQNDDD